MEKKITDGRMNIRGIRRTLCNIDALQEEKRRLESEMAVLVDMVQGCIAENARIAQDQEEYQKRYDGIIEDFDESLWGCMVEHITVGRNKEMTVIFRDGTEIQA